METAFGEIGMDSMSAVMLINIIDEAIKCRLPLSFLLEAGTCLKAVVGYLAEELNKKNRHTAAPTELVLSYDIAVVIC